MSSTVAEDINPGLGKRINKLASRIPVVGALMNIAKDNRYLREELDRRPPIEYSNYYIRDVDVQFPRLPISYIDIYEISRYCNVIRMCVYSVGREVFRRGYEWEQKFAAKCTLCEKEYDKEDPDGKCNECGGKLRRPDSEEYREADVFFKKVNKNKQSLLTVMRSIEDDLNTADDGYLIILKDYFLDENGRVVYSKPRELLRGSPTIMRIVGDYKGNLGGKFWVCLKHREVVLEKPGRCKHKGCNGILHDVHYVSLSWETSRGSIEEYYVEGEVIHKSKYSPGLLYGYSPIITVWKMAYTLIRMEMWMAEWYRKMRRPKQFIMATTRNKDSLIKSWDKMQQKVKKDPYYTGLLAIESETGKGEVKVVDLADTVTEMQYIDVRNEFRERISSLWQVTPIFQNDTSVGGGLNNEGLEILVTNRATEDGQKTHNEEYFPEVVALFGINDWCLKLVKSEERDESAELEREMLKVNIAQGMSTLGFDVERDEDGEFVYNKVMNSTEVEPDVGQNTTSPGLDAAGEMSGMPDNMKTASLKKKKSEGKEEEKSHAAVGEEITKEFWTRARDAIDKDLWSKFEGVSKSTNLKIKGVLTTYLDDGATEKVKSVIDKLIALGVEKSRAETIVKTEENVIGNKARELSFSSREEEQEEKFKYKWQVTFDKRTSPICKEIAATVSSAGKGGGVEMASLKKIIKKVVKKHTGKSHKDDFRTHPNCRSRVLRVI